MDRGERLYLERRKKNQVRKMIQNCWGRGSYSDFDFKDGCLSPVVIGKVASAPHSCSKACCQNPRHYRRGKDQLTIQERRNQLVA